MSKLDSAFWSQFAANVWEKKPFVVKNLESDLLKLNGDSVFLLLVRYANRCRKLKDPSGYKFFLDGQRLHDDEEVLGLLPRKSDHDLLGYNERMERQFGDYCLVCDELLQVAREELTPLTGFTSALYRQIGFPNRFAEMGLYLGNYRKTPFGVHVDGCGVFSFPVVGTKKFRLWEPTFVQKHPALDRAFEYAKFKRNSQVLTAGPGDMTYWPSSAWHIAESDGSFSATWSLGIWVDRTHTEVFAEALSTLLAEGLGPNGQATTTGFHQLHAASGEVCALPDAYQNSINRLKGLTETALHEHFLKSWMRHISAQGFKQSPALRASPLPARLALRHRDNPILWSEASDGIRLHLACNGVLLTVKSSKKLLALIKSLNAGKSCSAGTAERKALAPFGPAAVFAD